MNRKDLLEKIIITILVGLFVTYVARPVAKSIVAAL
jgi:hypothetical protein